MNEVWIVAYADRSGIWILPNELDALRFAVERACSVVKRVPLDAAATDVLELVG